MQDEGQGIQSLLVRRKVMIARYVARFITYPNCLWSMFRRARYEAWNQGSLMWAVHDYSFIWKEIFIYVPIVLDRVRCLIDDGISMDVCQDA